MASLSLNRATDILIIGGGTGGCAAALAACRMGKNVLLTEETDWIGGQLTAQLVPPDEHPWIEHFGCTATYRQYRNLVREFTRQHLPLKRQFFEEPNLNPGSGWVSRLCHEPRIGWLVLQQMLHRYMANGQLTILLKRKPFGVSIHADHVESVTCVNLETGQFEEFSAPFVLDATELGDLLWLSGTEYRVGAESKAQTAEPNAVDGEPEWDNVQGITWCGIFGYTDGTDRTISKPTSYEFWRDYKPSNWPAKLLDFTVAHAHTGVTKQLPLFNPNDWYELFSYRQIVDQHRFEPEYKIEDATVVNWPQNDYYNSTIMDVDEKPERVIPDGFEIPGAMGPVSAARLKESQDLTLSLLYWLQTEAPRHDSGNGYPGLQLRPDLAGTDTGLAKYPYIREARRIEAKKMVVEQEIAAYTNPGLDRAPSFKDSVGVGSYRIDLHPSTNGAPTIDTSTLPFEIPLGALIPVRVRNLIPACKNLGVTHITNGCYRLHPIEWNIGEAAGALAAMCHEANSEPHQVHASDQETETLQKHLVRLGVELHWPKLRAL